MAFILSCSRSLRLQFKVIGIIFVYLLNFCCHDVLDTILSAIVILEINFIGIPPLPMQRVKDFEENRAATIDGNDKVASLMDKAD